MLGGRYAGQLRKGSETVLVSEREDTLGKVAEIRDVRILNRLSLSLLLNDDKR